MLTAPLLYNNRCEVRMEGDTGHCWVWAPYNIDFIVDLKLTFCAPEALAGAIGFDKGAEWDHVIKAWHIYTGWQGCEDWYEKLISLLNKHFPCNHHAT